MYRANQIFFSIIGFVSYSLLFSQSTKEIEVKIIDTCYLFARHGTIEDEPLYRDSAVNYATSFVNLSYPVIEYKEGPSIVKTISDSLYMIVADGWGWRLEENEYFLSCHSRDTIMVFDYYYHNPEYYSFSHECSFFSKKGFSVVIRESWNAGSGGVGSSYFEYPFNIDLRKNRLITKNDIINPLKTQMLLKYIYENSEYSDYNSIYFESRPPMEDFINDEGNLEQFLITGDSIVFYIRGSYSESEFDIAVAVPIKKNRSLFSKKLIQIIRN